jgi:hypothetical protein
MKYWQADSDSVFLSQGWNCAKIVEEMWMSHALSHGAQFGLTCFTMQ